MTRSQCHAALDTLSVSVDGVLKEMVDNDRFSFTSITHKENLTQYDCCLKTDEIGVNIFACPGFYTYSAIYAMFNGTALEDVDVLVSFYSPDGTLIESSHLNTDTVLSEDSTGTGEA